ncbi:MAG: hypothetical protein EOO68_25540 [Moraxellaceae bacterium]|nr:MAG: hypothetical protein EOO68_25540 [Moraxellaceae bacterium]
MNELQRQMYLSALGMDTYMPRWQLPFAPLSITCELSVVEIDTHVIMKPEIQPTSFTASVERQSSVKVIGSAASPINNLIGDIFETKKSNLVNPVTSAADILAQLDVTPKTIDPFSLSIWRPIDGVMIVDSRNTKLALPTELLLNNILRSLFSNQPLKSQEEVLRWPMIENSFTKRTAEDARTELQTWLSVQHEIRPIHYLWLMGANAATHFLPPTLSFEEALHKIIPFNDSKINGLILPSLNELLQKPIAKQKLFSVFRSYQSAK